MAEKSLRVLQADKTFLGKITNTLTRLLIPTKVGINSLFILAKRNNVLKAFENYKNEESKEVNPKKEATLKKYEEMYQLYLESVDKYVMDSVYKKVKNDTASSFEKEALSRYYEVIHLKETQYLEYKYRKQKYLLELDYETIVAQNNEKTIKKYKPFYTNKMDSLYKGILKNYSIQLADNTCTQLRKDEIYEGIFSALGEYIAEILPIKMEIEPEKSYKEIMEEYEKFTTFLVGKLDEKDQIEKKMTLLAISRKLFTHSLPLVVAEQCYQKLLRDTRKLIVEAKTKEKQQNDYEMLIQLIEDYNIQLLSTKIYWEKPAQREAYKKFWEEYNRIIKEPIKEEDKKQKKEILFLQNELKTVKTEPENYQQIITFYKQKLVEKGVMRKIHNSYQSKKVKYQKRKSVMV